jgi:hypothetical protein
MDWPAPTAVEKLYGGLAKKTSLPLVSVANQQMYVNLIELRKCLDISANTSISAFLHHLVLDHICGAVVLVRWRYFVLVIEGHGTFKVTLEVKSVLD